MGRLHKEKLGRLIALGLVVSGIGYGCVAEAALVEGHVSGTNAVAVGNGSQAKAAGAVAIGQGSEVTAANGVAIGKASAKAQDSVAIGNSAEANAANATAIGGGKAKKERSTAVGQGAETENADATAVGAAKAKGQGSTAVGKGAESENLNSTAVGNAKAKGDNATAIGDGSQAQGANSVAIGGETVGENGVAIGEGSRAAVSNSVALGYNAKVETGEKGVAIGSGANAKNDETVAIGSNAKVELGNYGVAIGRNTMVKHTESVAIGGAAETGELHKHSEYNPEGYKEARYRITGFNYGNAVYDTSTEYAGYNQMIGSVSFGNQNVTRQLHNVAPGRVAADSTDAINGSQLYFAVSGLNARIDGLEAGGSGSGPSSKGVGGGSADGAWIAAVKNDSEHTSTEVADGNTVTYEAGKNVALALDESTNHITVATESDVSFNKVAVGSEGTGNKVDINNFGLTLFDEAGEEAVAVGTSGNMTVGNKIILGWDGELNQRITLDTDGIAMADKQITGLAAGVNNDDAVNVGQLNSAIGDAVAGISDSNTYTTGVTYDTASKKFVFTRNDSNTYGVDFDVAAMVENVLASLPATASDGGTAAPIASPPGDDHVKVGTYNVENNTVTLPLENGGNVVINDVASAKDLANVATRVGSVETRVGNVEIRVESVEDRVGNVETRVKGVEDRVGNVETRVEGVEDRVGNVETRVKGVEDRVGNVETRVEGVEDRVGNVETRVGNVEATAGTTSKEDMQYKNKDTNYIKDAVSLIDADQKLDAQIKTNADGIADNKGRIDVNEQNIANNKTRIDINEQNIADNSQRITNLGNKLNSVSNRVDKVGAGAAALAALHPMDFDPDEKLSFAAGYGNYRGQNAAALGAFYRPNEKVMMSIGGTMGNNDNMVNVGVSFTLDGKNNVSNSRTAMAKEIVDLRGQVAALTALVEKLVAASAVEVDAGMKLFPDVPANHWAYEYIGKLAAKGILEGYPDGNFDGDRTMTRYEFAAMLYRALQKGAAVDSRLLQEFEPELGRIRVDRVKGMDQDLNKIERVRVVKALDRDDYGSKIK